MKIEGEQVLIRILLDSKSKYEYIFPLYKHLIALGIKKNLAGLTVISCEKGFLKNKISKPVYLIEIVDFPERLNSFLELCTSFFDKILFTSERAHVFLYRTKDESRIDKKQVSIIDTSDKSRKKEVYMGKMQEKVLIRIFIGDSDRDKKSNKYLYDVFLDKAHEEGFIAGLIYKGIMGFGKAGRIRAVDTVELSRDLPVVVEIISEEDKLQNFLDFCDEHVGDGLITLEKIMVYNEIK